VFSAPDLIVVDVHEGRFFEVKVAGRKHAILKRHVVKVDVFGGGRAFYFAEFF
jgi:hypothetical protein